MILASLEFCFLPLNIFLDYWSDETNYFEGKILRSGNSQIFLLLIYDIIDTFTDHNHTDSLTVSVKYNKQFM